MKLRRTYLFENKEYKNEQLTRALFPYLGVVNSWHVGILDKSISQRNFPILPLTRDWYQPRPFVYYEPDAPPCPDSAFEWFRTGIPMF
jgi:hypothetical protein